MTLAAVEERVEIACARAGRSRGEITVVAVSKGRDVEQVAALYESGHRDFGENRADELVEKAASLPDDIRWHFVGHLQSRKARSVRTVASYLHSLDRESLGKAWLKGSGPAPPAFLQVNVGREPQKSGVMPEEAVEAASGFAAMGIHMVGVMAIVPQVESPNEARPFFRDLAEIRQEVEKVDPRASLLSMGMTDDFEVAVEEGATVIRVGRAIFEADQPNVS